jgi:hypothetical protein
MTPPRRWMVWMVVGALEAHAGHARPTLLCVLPVEPSQAQSSEPEPGPVPISLRCRLELARLAIASGIALLVPPGVLHSCETPSWGVAHARELHQGGGR